jgi:hypothetical protein
MIRSLLLGSALFGAGAAAWADPGTISFILSSSIAIGTAVISVKTIILVGLYVYGASRARKKARKAQARARAEYNASLQDRNITELQALPPWRIVVGRALTGGDVHAIFTTDKTGYRENGTTYTRPDALKHLVIVFADHECQAIHELYIDGVPLGPLDGSGFPTGGEFFSTRVDTQQAVIEGGGSVTVARPVVTVLQAYTQQGSGDNYSTTNVAGSITLTNGNLTINGPANAVVDYTVQANLNTVRVQKHLGTSTQTVDTYLNSVVPSQWTSTDRLLNKCYIVLTLDLEDQRFQGAPPGIVADISGRKVYDPRKDSTNGGSGSHRATDSTTWEWSDNAALATRDYLQAEWGYDNDPSDINDAFTIVAANVCGGDSPYFRHSAAVQAKSDTVTASATANTIIFTTDQPYAVGDGLRFTTTGTLPAPLATATTYYVIKDADAKNYRLATSVANAYAGTAIDITSTGSGTHTCTWHDYAPYKANGVIVTEGDGKEATLDDLAESMAGEAVYGAQWELIAGVWTSPIMDLGDNDLAGQIEIVQADTPLDQLINSVRGTYIPAGKSVPQEFDNYVNSTLVTEDGQEHWEDLALPFTDSKVRARNLSRIRVETGRNGQVIRFPATLKAWPIQRGDRVRISSTEYGLTLKNYRVTDWQDAPQAVVLTCQEDDSAALDLADQASADATPNTGLPSPWVVAQLGSLSASSGLTTGILTADGSWQARIKVTWAAVTDAYITDAGRIVVMYRTPRGTEWLRVEVPGGETSAFLPGVREGDPVVIEAVALNSLGQYGPPAFLSHTVAVTQDPNTFASTVLVAHGTAGSLLVTPGRVVKIANGGAWNAGVYSKSPIQGACRVSWVVPVAGTDWHVGLKLNPSASTDYTSFDYGINGAAANTIDIYELASLRADNVTTHAAADGYSIDYTGSAVIYRKGSTLLRQLAVPPGLTLSAAVALYGVGAEVSNIKFEALSPAPRGNLLDTGSWTVTGTSADQGTSGGNRFVRAGDPATEDIVIMAAGPDGKQAVYWEATSSEDVITDAAGAGDGGWVTDYVPIDATQPYRFVTAFYLHTVTGTAGTFFFGPGPSFSNLRVADIATGAQVDNPYFFSIARSQLVPGRLYLGEGWIFPASFGTTPPSPSMSGLYDTVTGQRVANGADFKWMSDAARVAHRTFQFYSSTGNKTRWDRRFQRLEMADAAMPSIDELLAVAKTSGSTNRPISFADAYSLNGQFTNWVLGQTEPDSWTAWNNPAGTITKETTTTRTGPNAVRMTNASSSNDVGLQWIQAAFTSAPLPAGSFFEVGVDAYVVSNTSGGSPQLFARLFTNSAFTTQRDTAVVIDKTQTGAWQTVKGLCAVNSGERIYGVYLYLMCSWSGASGGRWLGDIIWDSVTCELRTPANTEHIVPNAATDVVQNTSTTLSKSFTASAGFPYRVERFLQISWTNNTGATVTVELASLIYGTKSAGAGSVWLDANKQFSSAMTSGDFSSLSADLQHTDATSSHKRYAHNEVVDVSSGSTLYFCLTAYINTAAGTTTDYSGGGNLRITVLKR